MALAATTIGGGWWRGWLGRAASFASRTWRKVAGYFTPEQPTKAEAKSAEKRRRKEIRRKLGV